MAHIVIDARIIHSSTGTYVERLLTYLDRLQSEHHFTVLVPTKDLEYWQPTGNNFTIKAADFDNYSLAEQLSFHTLLQSLSPDVVHFCMPQQPVRYRGTTVTTFHDLTLLSTYNSDKNWLLFHFKQLVGKYVFKTVARKSTHIITPSKFTKDDLVRFAKIPADNVTVTYEAAEPASLSLEPYDVPFSRFILYVGQQSDYKNIARLGDAHQKLLETHPDLGLVLVGKLNASAQKNKQCFESQSYKNILFTDFIPNAQRDWLYTKASAYVFPSLMEGFGLPGLEAMAYGAPVVSSNATCLPEVYGPAAEYFDPLDIGDMARAIDAVISSPKRQKDLRQKGFEQCKNYSWETMARQTLAVYEKALAAK